MEKCTLQIRLDPHQNVYRWSHRVRGEVVVAAHESLSCRELSIRLNWKTWGTGSRTSGEDVAQHLVPARWEAGKEYRYPFELTVPVGPPTSSGRFFEIKWEVIASAAVGWVEPVIAAQVIQVGRAARWDKAAHGPGSWEPEERLKSEGLQWGCGMAFAILLLAVGSLLLWWAATAGMNVWKIVIGVPAAGLGAFCMAAMLKRGVAAKKLGDPEVHISSANVSPGDTIAVSVRLLPRAPVSLGLIMMHLRGLERAESGSSNTRKIFEESLANQSFRLLPAGRSLARGEALELKGDLQVPRTSRATFSGNSQSVTWWIDVSVAIAGWPDWERRFPIMVESLPIDEPSVDVR
jgi:hypothetical protein